MLNSMDYIFSTALLTTNPVKFTYQDKFQVYGSILLMWLFLSKTSYFIYGNIRLMILKFPSDLL